MSSFEGNGIQHSGQGDMIARDITINGMLQSSGPSAQEKAQEKFNCLLQDLRVIDYRDAKAYIQDMKGSPLPAAYNWILEHDGFLHWRDDTQGRVLMIRGGPGKGKTMLLCGIVDHLTTQTTEARPVAYFFCQASDARLNNGTAVLRGLLHMLLCRYPDLVLHIQKDYDEAGKALFEGRESFECISRILTNMLSNPILDNLILIIDALDECITKRQQLLAYIRREQANSTSSSRWLVSSRDFPGLDDELNICPGFITVRLELNETAVTKAVQSYIEVKVDWLSTLKTYDSQTRQVVARYLSENANGTFLWVALACEELSYPDTLNFEIEEKLKALPPGLESLYDEILKQLCDRKHAKPCLSMLATIAGVFRPLSIMELASITDLPINVREDPRSVKSLLKLCSSFLIFRGDMIHLVHQSAKEFIFGVASSRIFPLGEMESARRLFRASLAAMARVLTRDIYHLDHPNVTMDEINTYSGELDPLSPIRYACFYWTRHLLVLVSRAKTEAEIMEDLEETTKFVSTKFLPWLEAMSLQRSISTAIHSLGVLLSSKNIKSTIFAAPGNATWTLLEDALQFAAYHKYGIEKSPLQLYISALIFSPTGSRIRQLYEKEEPKWFECKPAMESFWTPRFHTFEGHRGPVTSLAECPRRYMIASGSEDKTVKIWHSPSGACLFTLEGHDSVVTTVAFSVDGLSVASGSEDGTVNIWNVAGGELKQSLTHCHPVTSVAFSPDGKQIASGGHDGTVKVWGLSERMGEILQTFHHPEPVLSFVFVGAPGRQVMTGCRDGQVRMWDLTSNTSTTIGMSVGYLLAMSRDGSVVAVAWPEECIARAWNVRTRADCMVYRDEVGDIRSIALSDDGKLMAIGTDTCIIKIMDTTSMSCLQTLQGHGGYISVVLFSTNHTILSGSSDEVITAWRVESRKCQNAFDYHGSFIYAVACSSDGLIAASGSYDTTAKLWDTVNGKCRRTLRGHDDSVYSVAFSGDDQKLVTGSYDSLVKIWDVSSGDCVKTLRGHTDIVWTVAFSSDSLFVVSGSSDLSIKLWDAMKGTCLQALHGHCSPVKSVAISADSDLIASTDEKTIKIWELNTGMCIQTLPADEEETDLRFAREVNTRLYTNRRMINLDHEAIMTELVHEPYVIDEKYVAIRGTDKIIWLPPEYRALETAYAKSTVVLGCASGRVLCLRFKMNDRL